MATVVNDRDVLIMGASPRYTPPTDRGMFLTPSTAVFKLSADGQSTSPSSFQFVATLLNMTGTVTWSTTGGISLVTNGNTATLNFASFSAVSGTITATITVDGQQYTQISTVTKLADGAVTYTWIKYADSAAGAGLSDDPTGKAYIGLAYNKTTATESTTAADYTWSLIKGADGATGQKGADGSTLYTWIKYADVADGTGLYDTPTASTMYIGLAVNKTSATKSTVKSDYVWSKFKGDQGVAGSTGPQGIRGNVDISAVTSGSIWSDTEAAAALAAAGYGAPQVRDMVNLYRADRTFSAQRMYNGSVWIAIDYVWNGNVFVKGSILPEAIDTRGLTIRDAGGNIILNAGLSLAQQTRTNPNLCPTPQGLRAFNGTGLQRNGDSRFGDGQFVYIPPYVSGDTFIGIQSPALGIPANSKYTVSFDAYCEGATRALYVDVYDGLGYDSIGRTDNLTNTLTRYSFTETMQNNANAPRAFLRMWAPGSGSPVVITNIKVELGEVVTPWCSNIITKANASTSIQAAAIDFAFIDKATISSLSAITAYIGVLESRTSGARLRMQDDVIKVFNDQGIAKVKLGNRDL